VAAGVITLLALALAAAIAAAQERLVGTMRAGVAQVKQWGGIILIVVGVWFLILAIWADFFARIFPV
jgi:putative Mn2+ efflux pump MntP